MRVIARTRLMELARPWPDARSAVADWYSLAEAAAWTSPQDIRRSDPTASILANRRVVFTILGNRFHLIVTVDYAEQKLFVRFFGAHQQYNAITAAEV